MSKIHIDTYYDLTCQECGKSRSTDFEMGMETNKARLSRVAYSEGWKCKGGYTLCPACSKIVSDSAWVSVKLGNIPLKGDSWGLAGMTEDKYWVIAHGGYVCYGHIYRNRYSETGYSVKCRDGVYYNNVSYWAPNGKPKSVKQ